MKILIVGSGLMGPAAAYNAMSDPGVATVTLADIDAAQLDAARRKLAPLPGGDKIVTRQLDLSDRDAAITLFSGHDVILAALPWSASRLAFDAAVHAGRPIVDLAIPEDEHLPELRRAAGEHGVLIALGCGLEPGLTEIMARYLALRLDSVQELHIKCGGIPEAPSGPLGYKIVFGGRQLPLRDIDALVVEGGRPFMARRYSGHELTGFDGVGEVEGWHEGMMPWLLDLPEFAALTEGTQKTLRWPGYAAKATVLLDLGLLGRTPVSVNGVDVIPKQLVDTLLYPSVELKDGEGDITLFRVEVIGMKDGVRTLHRADMVDRYDRALGFTSMARTTAFTGAIVARMIGRGDISATGLHYADGIVTAPLFELMMKELATAGVHFDITPA